MSQKKHSAEQIMGKLREADCGPPRLAPCLAGELRR